MTKKINIGNSQNLSPVFSRIISEINATEIPVKYIEKIAVTFSDGGRIELTGDEITHPVPINKRSTWENMQKNFSKVQEVKVFIKLQQLEEDINKIIAHRLRKYPTE